MVGRGEHVLALGHQTGLGDLRGHLGRRQDAAVAGLGALGDLDLDHLDLRQGGVLAERLRLEVAVGVPAPEVAGADLPDEVAAGFRVVLRQAPLAGVVGEPTRFRALVHGAYGGLAQGSEAHRGDVEHRRRVGLGALRAADGHPQVGLRVRDHRPGGDGVVQPAVAGAVHVALGAERLLVPHVLRSLVDHRPGVPVERSAVGVVLHEVLVQLRPHPLQQEPHPPGQRVVAQDAVPQLEVVVDAQQHQRHEQDLQEPPPRAHQEGEGNRQQGKDDDRPQGLGADAFDHECCSLLRRVRVRGQVEADRFSRRRGRARSARRLRPRR